MTPFEAMAAVRSLACFALCLSGFEFLLLSRRPSFQRIWSDQNLGPELLEGLPLPGAMIRCLFSRSFFPVLATLEIVSALALAVVPSVGWVLLLMVSHLMICIRFRGTYNGGSDMMTFVVLTGLLIGLIVGEERGYQIGLLYIALHAGYSYLKAGLVKFAQKDWRTGAALPVFLGRSLLPPARALGLVLDSRPVLTAGLSWLVIVFEIAIFGLLFVPEWSLFYAGLALGFHFGNFLLFGLNRFFWIWLAAWPALLSGLSLSLS